MKSCPGGELYRRKSRLTRVVLPLPVLPTMARVLPAGRSMSIFFRALVPSG